MSILKELKELPDRLLVARYVFDKLVLLEDQYLGVFSPESVSVLRKAGLRQAGHIAARTAATLENELGLPAREVRAFARQLENYGHGLKLGYDTSDWSAYRTTVPENFRIPWSLHADKGIGLLDLGRLYTRLQRLIPVRVYPNKPEPAHPVEATKPARKRRPAAGAAARP